MSTIEMNVENIYKVVNGQYYARTKQYHDEVEILCVAENLKEPRIVGTCKAMSETDVQTWTMDGSYFHDGSTSMWDIEICDYKKGDIIVDEDGSIAIIKGRDEDGTLRASILLDDMDKLSVNMEIYNVKRFANADERKTLMSAIGLGDE